jgi:protein-S-isoprenylcysteine O-methyltransferase Ste14
MVCWAGLSTTSNTDLSSTDSSRTDPSIPRAQRSRTERQRKTWWEQRRTRLSQALAVIALLLVGLTESHWEESHPAVASLLYSFGLALAAIGAAGRIWCSFFISGRKDGELVCEGPYSISRNPLYLFSCLGLTGIGLCTETLTYPLVFLLLFGLYYPSILWREERRLEELFGEAYRSYLNRVPRFWPRLALYQEPQRWLSNPRLFRRHILNDICFVWLAALIELIEGLRRIGVLPHLFHLW